MIRQFKTVKELNFEKAARKGMVYLGCEALDDICDLEYYEYRINLHLFYREKNDSFYGFSEVIKGEKGDEFLVKLNDGLVNSDFIDAYRSIINRYNERLAIKLAAFIHSEKESERSKSL